MRTNDQYLSRSRSRRQQHSDNKSKAAKTSVFIKLSTPRPGPHCIRPRREIRKHNSHRRRRTTKAQTTEKVRARNNNTWHQEDEGRHGLAASISSDSVNSVCSSRSLHETFFYLSVVQLSPQATVLIEGYFA